MPVECGFARVVFVRWGATGVVVAGEVITVGAMITVGPMMIAGMVVEFSGKSESDVRIAGLVSDRAGIPFPMRRGGRVC